MDRATDKVGQSFPKGDQSEAPSRFSANIDVRRSPSFPQRAPLSQTPSCLPHGEPRGMGFTAPPLFLQSQAQDRPLVGA